jgi:hypothetical protein
MSRSFLRSVTFAILLAVPARAEVALRFLGDASGKRLAVFKDGKELGSIAAPATLSAPAIEAGLAKVLWHPNGSDLAVGFKGEEGSFVAVFLVQANGSYLGVNVSRVERVNIGAIGPNRTYRNVQTAPTGWLDQPQGDDAVQVWLETQAWDVTGQRYTGREPLIVTRNGMVLWR